MIKTHKELAEWIAGKKILHMNSLGKDSIVALEWLTTFAVPQKVYSVYYQFLAKHPGDDVYLKYLKKRYPQVEFIVQPNAIEVSNICIGIYQTPMTVMNWCNGLELNDFEMSAQTKELKNSTGSDYICSGYSKYESFARATKFHKKGLLIGDQIYPLGMMKKSDILGVIKNCGIKLHPSYKTSPSTYDHPSYWKMRNAFVANSQYRSNMMSLYPMIALDEYRWERLMK